MRKVRIGVALLFFSCVSAECAVKVSAFVDDIADQIETGGTDQQIARHVGRVKLLNALADEDIRWLEVLGGGPETVKAARKLAQRSAYLPQPAEPVITEEPRPSADETTQILERITAYVGRYTSGLVNFTCTVTTNTYTREKEESRPLSDTSVVVEKDSSWHAGNPVTREVSYYKGREYYRDRSGAGSDKGWTLSPGASWSSGEFVNTLKITFSDSSRARFRWENWRSVGGTKLAVFSYSVEVGESRLAIATQVFRDGAWRPVQIYAGYQGFIFAEPDTGIVRRLIVNTKAIPSNYAISKGSTMLDYAQIDVAGAKYFLVTQASSYIRTKQYDALFRKKFSRYRKFEAESEIHF